MGAPASLWAAKMLSLVEQASGAQRSRGCGVMGRDPEIERLPRRPGAIELLDQTCLGVAILGEDHEQQLVERALPVGLGGRVGKKIAQRVVGVCRLDIAVATQLPGGRAECPVGVGHARIFLVHEVLVGVGQNDTHDDWPVAAAAGRFRHQQQLAVVVSRQAMEEFGKVHQARAPLGATGGSNSVRILAADRRSPARHGSPWRCRAAPNSWSHPRIVRFRRSCGSGLAGVPNTPTQPAVGWIGIESRMPEQ
jgi:hypothetical protein